MKKRFWAVLFALVFCLSAASAQGAVPVPAAGEPVFSNLNGVDVLDATMELLRQGGVDAQSVDVLSAWVLDYNVLCQNNPVYRLAGEYAPMPEGAVNYGEEVDVYAAFAQQWWEGAQREYPDLTARVIAYWLLRDAISIANPLASQDWDSEGWLSSDADCIAGNPNLRLDEAQTRPPALPCSIPWMSPRARTPGRCTRRLRRRGRSAASVLHRARPRL